MKTFLALTLLAMACVLRAADPAAESFTGHFALAKNTKAPFVLDVLQKGRTATTSFSAGNEDGSGAAPDGDGEGALNAKGELEFKWTDTFDNAGTATLRRDGKLFHLSMKVSKAADPRALKFYGETTLKRTSTKPQMSTR
jgi:hypothetical protein